MRILSFTHSDNERNTNHVVLSLIKLWKYLIIQEVSQDLYILGKSGSSEVNSAKLNTRGDELMSLHNIYKKSAINNTLSYIEEATPDMLVVAYNTLYSTGVFNEDGKDIKKIQAPNVVKVPTKDMSLYEYKYEININKEYNIINRVMNAIKLINYLFNRYLKDITEDTKLSVNVSRKKSNIKLTLCTNNKLINEIIEDEDEFLTFIFNYSQI